MKVKIIGAIVFAGVFASAAALVLTKAEPFTPDVYTAYYGEKPILRLNPTGDKRCDDLKITFAKLINEQVAKGREQLLAIRKSSDASERGVATLPGEEQDRSNVMSTVWDKSEADAVRKVASDVKGYANKALFDAKCIDRLPDDD